MAIPHGYPKRMFLIPSHIWMNSMMISEVTNPPDTRLGQCDVRVFRTVAELEEIRPLWESWSGNRDSDPNVFFNILHTTPEVLRPHVIVVHSNGQPAAMLVGRLEHSRLDFKVGYIHLRPTAMVLYFVYGGPRGDVSPGNCTLLVHEICRSLAAGEADAAYLNYLRMDGPLHQISRTMPAHISRDRTRIMQTHFSATLPKSAQEYYANLSAFTRRRLKTKMNKLDKVFAGSVKIHCITNAAETDTLAADAEVIMKTSYQRGLGVGFADTPAMREQLRMRAEKGWLRAYVLYLANRPAAFWIGDLNQTTFRSEYTAYHGDFAKYSPGIYLMLKVIEGFCSERGDLVTEVDFATGAAQYKEILSNHEWYEASVHIFAPSVKGIQLKLIKSFTAATDHILKDLLARAGLLQKIKKNWRDHVTRKKAGELQTSASSL
jgi:hypothetical protein